MYKIGISKIRIAQILMIAAIILISGFQIYWLHKQYTEEAAGFKKTTDLVFRETMYKVQAQRLKKDSFIYKYIPEENSFMGDVAELVNAKIPKISITAKDNNGGNEFTFSTNMDSIEDGVLHVNESKDENTSSEIILSESDDSVQQREVNNKSVNLTQLIQNGIKLGLAEARKAMQHSSIVFPNPPDIVKSKKGKPHPVPKKIAAKDVLVKSNVLNDTISIEQIDSVYTSALLQNGITAKFTISKDSIFKNETGTINNFTTSKVPVGFLNKNTYQANFDPPTFILMSKMFPQISLSFLLIAFISITFLFLYRNMISQKRLAIMKNDFISNITHELKTPIATVNVAIEALQNFDALKNPVRTKEYLDISAGELQRLTMLVDKVLRLSMFENKEIELQKENVDFKKLIEEILHSMQLQFEKNKARVNFIAKGKNFHLQADRMHLTSVIYNLLDNALKYSSEYPDINIEVLEKNSQIQLFVSDNGIGIPDEYSDKIFDKFFRVPSGNLHNIKGYGLGLSYVAEVIRKHNGTIEIESVLGKGTNFIIKLPSVCQ